ncbi:MAG: hypothetical protein FWC06_05635 [Treponema sp.]|nr:hypothetical protein [Treponema sp.]
MKINNKDNPFNVQAGQKWKSKDSRRERKFKVVQIERFINGHFAVVDYGGLQTMISLERFSRYVRCR